MIGRNTNKQRGSIMITTAVCLFVLIGMLGLSIDLGRVYVAKNEAQAFADLAAVAAARNLNGTQSGIDAANTEVTTSATTNKWNFGTTQFGSDASTSPAPTVEFSTAATGAPWSAAPGGNLKDVKFVRVTAKPTVKLAFLPVVGTALTQQVTGQAVGGVVLQTFPAGGYLPFTPFAHDASTDPLTGKLNDPNFGFSVGEAYGFLWPGNINKASNACEGDQINWPMYNSSDNSVVSGSDRGYFELQSAADIRDAILGGKQTDPLAVGDYVDLTSGQKQTEQTALETRALSDTDQTAYDPTPGTAPPYYGNGMREVIMPVNDRNIVSGEVKIIGFAAFLIPKDFNGVNGNQAWCAIYMGSRTQGGDGKTEFDPGAYVVRLVQ